MKKNTKSALVLFLALFITGIPICAADTCSAKSAILIEASSGDIIYEKNAHEKMPMASTTKIMTAIVALEHGNLNDTVTVSNESCGVEGSSIYLTPGETLTLEDLLYALMLESANDAAAAIAYHISGGIEEFANMMNDTAERIGVNNTHFTNPHGLDNEAHYTTASDLARITAYALKNEDFRKIVSTYKKQIPLRGDEGVRVLLNHNKLLRISDDVIGVKTGFTKHSGRCLVSAAERDGVCLIAVTLSDPNDWRDHTDLHEMGFSLYSCVSLATPGEFCVQIPCPGAPDGYLEAKNTDSLTKCVKNGSSIHHLVEADRMVFPPICEGETLGKVSFYSDDTLIGEVPLFASFSVEEPTENRSLGKKILDFFR